jgi:CPA1 family monovalent cation:H+ antiporter
VSFVIRWILILIKDSFSEVAITLLAPYIAWVLAEQAHGSAVLACVAGGLYLRRHLSTAVAPSTRIQARAVWELLVFLLNGVIFILIGLQLGTLRDAVPSGELDALILVGALVSVTAIVVRLLWVPVVAWMPRLVSPRLGTHDPMPPWANLFIIGWAGMRGIVSLASAMALPLTTAAGTPFPFRAEIILIAFTVILVTLVLQGLSLPVLIRALKVREDRGRADEERQAREQAASAALARLEEMASENWPVPEQIERMRDHYRSRLRRSALSETIDPEWSPEAAEAYRRLRHETLTAERLAAIRFRNDGVISDEVLHRLEHELDVEALRAGVGELRVSPEKRPPKNH